MEKLGAKLKELIIFHMSPIIVFDGLLFSREDWKFTITSVSQTFLISANRKQPIQKVPANNKLFLCPFFAVVKPKKINIKQ